MVDCGSPSLILILQAAQFEQEGSTQRIVVVLNDVETCIFSPKTSNAFQYTVLLGHDRDSDNKEDNDTVMHINVIPY